MELENYKQNMNIDDLYSERGNNVHAQNQARGITNRINELYSSGKTPISTARRGMFAVDTKEAEDEISPLSIARPIISPPLDLGGELNIGVTTSEVGDDIILASSRGEMDA